MNENEFTETIVETSTAVAVPRMKFNLICASKCKKYAIDVARIQRAKKFSRVGMDFLVACEANLKLFIQSRVQNHPSKGKTLTWHWSQSMIYSKTNERLWHSKLYRWGFFKPIFDLHLLWQTSCRRGIWKLVRWTDWYLFRLPREYHI